MHHQPRQPKPALLAAPFPWSGLKKRFWFYSHGLRCRGSVDFAVQCSPCICPVKPHTAQASCTKSVSECTREAWPRYNTWLRDYKPVQSVDAAPHRGAPKVTGRANCTAAMAAVAIEEQSAGKAFIQGYTFHGRDGSRVRVHALTGCTSRGGSGWNWKRNARDAAATKEKKWRFNPIMRASGGRASSRAT